MTNITKKTFIALLASWAFNTYANDSIMVIESYHAEYAWDQSYISGLKEVLGGSYDLSFFEMDTKRKPTSEHQAQADAAWAAYQKMEPKPKVVVLGDDNALKFLGKKFLTESETPIIYLGINNNPRKYDLGGNPKMAGVIERPLIKRSIVMMKDFINMNRGLVLFDSGSTSVITRDEIFDGKDNLTIGSTDLDIRLVDTFDNWKKFVTGAKDNGYDVIFLGLYQTIIDSSGANVNAEEVAKWTSENTPIPLLGFWDFSVGPTRALGGYVLFGAEQGKAAGELVKKMANGEITGATAPVAAEKGRFLFSQSLVNKWNIQLPDHIKSQATFID